MATSSASEAIRNESPDPASHAPNIYDTASNEEAWLDETDDDDMDFEPTADESEDVEFYDPTEDTEAEFHGTWVLRVMRVLVEFRFSTFADFVMPF